MNALAPVQISNNCVFLILVLLIICIYAVIRMAREHERYKLFLWHLDMKDATKKSDLEADKAKHIPWEEMNPYEWLPDDHHD